MNKTIRNLTMLGAGLGISTVVGWFFLREKHQGETNELSIRSKGTTGESQSSIPNIVLPLNEPVIENTDSPTVTATTTSTSEPPHPDDLTQIRDIGPKFADALRSIGIFRFDQLATETPESLAERLMEHVTVRPQRIREKDWIGQAAELARDQA